MSATDQRIPALEPGESWDALRARLGQAIEALTDARARHAGAEEILASARRSMSIVAERADAERHQVELREAAVADLAGRLLAHFGPPGATIIDGRAF